MQFGDVFYSVAGHEMDSSQASAECRRSNAEVLHLAGEVTQMQSKVSSAASKLLQSADMVRRSVCCLLLFRWLTRDGPLIQFVLLSVITVASQWAREG